VSLGAVQCVAAARVSPDTLGLEDSAAPAAGRAFFYLVEYNDGARSGYGTESAPKPQIPGSGDCP